MLTPNINQFIPQDYYASLPTTLDAKKSPLALLAQTCSQIGNDNPIAKSSTLVSTEKCAKYDKSSPSSSSNGSGSSPLSTTASAALTAKSSFKPYESCLKKSEKCVGTVERKTSPCKTTPPVSSHHHYHRNPSSSKSSPSISPNAPSKPTSTSSICDTLASPAISSPATATCVGSVSKSTDSLATSLKSLSASAVHPNFIPAYPLDMMASNLLTAHPLKAAAAAAAASANAYLNGYGRLKSGGDCGVVPVCRDPYCTSCQLSSHLMGAPPQNGKSCLPGCTQCDISKSHPSFLSSSAPASPSSKANAAHHSSSLAAAYAQAQLAALTAASQMPYVCSWMSADIPYCGKQFVTADELLQHLRTHTAADPLARISPTGCHSLLGRTYPTPPLSPLSTARYHPYSKPPFVPHSLFPLQVNPALHPAFSPYLFYNSKLGSTSHH